MTEQVVATFTDPTRYIACPACGTGRHGVSHLVALGRVTFGPWYCDACGHGFTGEVVDAHTVVTRPHGDRKVPTLVTLELPPQAGPVRFLVEGMRFVPADGSDDGEDHDAQDAYFYEEHTCPSNWLGVDVVAPDGDPDPHGLFRWVSTEVDQPQPE